ncbi:NAD(+) synthase [Aeromonas media]|uniref:NAD(+) synthase n=1 Tax=Aeromonas media TaxID=651 RepID=UPI003D20E7FF
MQLIVSSASLNLIPMDFDGNKTKIESAIYDAHKSGAMLVALPELSVTGYGCEDNFLMGGIADDAIDSLLSVSIPSGMVAAIGLPVLHSNRMYNTVAVCVGDENNELKVLGFVAKQNLAKSGIHYESRWFCEWNSGVIDSIELPNGDVVPFGDCVFDFDGVRIGFEICEDAWVASRPGRKLFERGVDVIINPSASHFAIGKHSVREQFVKEGSRSFGAAYIYSNLCGCEAGRTVYDGGCMIASNGDIVAKGSRLHFGDVSVITATIDLQSNRNTHVISGIHADNESVRFTGVKIASKGILAETVAPTLPYHQAWQEKPFIEHEEACRAIALGLRDWHKKTGTSGFALSLSGGADSGLVAALLYLAKCYDKYESMGDASKGDIEQLVENAKAEMRAELDCVYQGSDNSSDTTMNAAKMIAEGIGASFYNWSISDLVEGYTSRINEISEQPLSWEKDDIALQNIQARVRSPGIWMLANCRNKLLLTTGNLSETTVGYFTMDGDSSGVIAPIAGVSKTRVLDILGYLVYEGTLMSKNESLKIPALKCIICQKPTAELRPEEQSDEADLMPFEVLDEIRRQVLLKRRRPKVIFVNLCAMFKDYTREELASWLKKFYTLFNRSQWKRERMAAGFHIEAESMDSRTFSRFPMFSSGISKELDELL